MIKYQFLVQLGGGINWSYEEQNTGLKWVDGKDVFVRTINISELTSGTSQTYKYWTIPNTTNILQLIKYNGILGMANNSATQFQWFNIDYNNISTSKTAWVRWVQTYNETLERFVSTINIWTNNDSLTLGFITIYYTKM